MKRIYDQVCLFTLLLAVTLFIYGCPPTTVIIDGREMPIEQAAELAYQDAQKDLKAGHTDQAIRKLERFVISYQSSSRMDEALIILGDLYFQKEDYEKAVKSYQHMMADHPYSTHYVKAAIQLGMALFKVGRSQEALPTLQSVFDRMDGDPRKQAEVAGMLAESYLKTGAPVDSLRWYAVLYKLTNVPGSKQALYEQVINVIDHHMNFTQTREAIEMFRQEQVKDFPIDLLEFKLAKIFYHILDFERARQNLERFLAEYPDHELAQDATSLITRIIDRAKVDSKAVGVLLPLSGQLREYGKRTLEAIQLGMGVFNDHSSSKDGFSPVLIIRDTAGDPNQAVKQFEELVYKEHVIAVIGPMTANAASAVAIKAEELQVPIVALSKKKDLTKTGPYVFRNFLTLASQADLLVTHAIQQLGATKFAILYPNDYYGVEFANSFWDEVDRQGGEVRAAERYEPDTKNFSPHIKKMVGRYYLDAREDFQDEKERIQKEDLTPLARKRAMSKLLKTIKPMVDFQVIFVPDYVDNVVLIAPALAFEDIVLQTKSLNKIDRVKKSLGQEELDMVYLLGGNGWNSLKVIEWARRYVQGAIFCDSFFSQSNRMATKRFMKTFTSNFEREPSAIEAEAYDTALIVRIIIEKNRPVDRVNMRESLLRVENFSGASGNISFQPDGEVKKSLFLLTIERDQIIEINQKASSNAAS